MFPIKDTIPGRYRPVMVVALILLNVVVFAFESLLAPDALEWSIHVFGLVPARFADREWAAAMGYPSSYLPFFTSMFLHAGLLRLASNV